MGAQRLETALRHWANAIRYESAEHGRPNSFGVLELAGEFGNLDKRDGYRIGQRYLVRLWECLGGRVGWGSRPTYSKGRIYV